ncbi:MAG: DUF58 domain-containing protein [Candidatus Woesearchaeota archaeon]|nr:DUF58 domain-containing protein [Candidatus Woesearchaeota archaeon]
MPLKEFRADLFPKSKEIAMKVKKDFLTTAMAGELASKLKGRGIEFEDYRDYSVTDDASRIDWLASQRAQRMLVREYKVDINFNAFFLIDTSESMLYGSTKKLKCEYAAEVVNSIFFGILNSGNAVGFAMFNEGIKAMLKPRMGKKQFHLLNNELRSLKNYGGKKDVGGSIRQALSLLDKRNLIFFVSDFVDADIANHIKIMCNVHEVIGIMIRDPRDLEIPSDAGQIIFQDPFSNETLRVDAKHYAPLYKEYVDRELGTIRKVFQNSKSALVELRTDEPFFHNLLKFFGAQGSRWR